MFKRYPYWAWLLLSILLWGITANRFYTHHRALSQEKAASVVSDDLHKRQQSLNALLNSKELLKKIFYDSLSTEQHESLEKLPFYFYAYENDVLVYWNTNSILINAYPQKDSIKLVHLGTGYYLEQYIGLAPERKIVALIPVFISSPIENEYLKSHFVAADYIPSDTKIRSWPDAESIAVKDISGKDVFFIKLLQQDMQAAAPDNLLICFFLLALIVAISWLQLMIVHISRRTSYILGFLITLFIGIIVVASAYRLGLPFGLDNLPFFSPQLYASNAFLSSLGNLFIDTMCFLWVIVFIILHTPYKTFLINFKTSVLKKSLAGLLAILLVVYSFGFVNIIRGLVLDSNISFDVSHFYSINLYTVLGLFVIGIITGVSCIVIYLFNIFIRNLLDNKWVKYSLIALAGLICIWLGRNETRHFNYSLLAWLLAFIMLLDVRNLKLIPDLFAPHMVFWAVFICVFCTGILQYFNHIKERESRKIFAMQHIAPERDDFTEYAFARVSQNIQRDKVVKAFLAKPISTGRKEINEYFDALFLGGMLNKYQAKIYLFDEKGIALFNKDTAAYKTLANAIRESIPTVSGSLYYRENIPDGHHYLACIPVKAELSADTAGFVFIDLSLKQIVSETVYPELLQPSSVKTYQNENEYAYGIYANGRLITQTNDYPFQVYLANDTMHTGQQFFINRKGASELWYKLNERKTVIVVHRHNFWIETISLFSYLFVTLITISLIILFYQVYLRYFLNPSFSHKFVALTLRRRVHLSMLGVVFVSFLIIGVVTIYFFNNEYNTSNITKLQSTLQVVEQSLQEFLKGENAFANKAKFEEISTSAKFRYFITSTANSQKIDINIYSNAGRLFATSQEDIYDKALLYPIIRPDAYYNLITLGRSILIQDEKIGELPFLSGYVPLRNEQGRTLGYINVPFFSSQKDLDYQVSNIVVTLINLYAFIFLVSSIFTVIITRWMTRSFNMIIKQFGQLNLQRNERIKWPYDDEIGTLVKEYNNMVKKVEENAVLLAQSERESAWREMARQVAHEIKNPLTPMKLNIQYLQQALRANKENVKELADKVAESMIEQIDNLSYIASEFSNFAKMPEARPEDIELNELLDKAVELYQNLPNIKVNISAGKEKVMVYADHSQMLRVFTNLLENAKQAIPAEWNGIIDVKLTIENHHVQVSIADNGTGIPEDVIPKIFKPYFTTKSSGTGLGLAMTKKIIEFWKGHIWFETDEGKGTTFYIRLPIVP